MDDGRKSYAKELVRRSTGRDDLDGLLRELYVDKRHSQAEIAKALGVSRMAINSWLGEYGISREERAGIVLTGPEQAL
jgi:DNA-binding XRE family transcriptional regulator